MESSTTGEGTDAELALIEVAENIVLLLGDEPPEGLEVEPFYLETEKKNELLSALAGSAAAMNLFSQVDGALTSVQGLVRLSPDTLRALKTQTPFVKDGWYGGTLRIGNEFSHSVKWAPVGEIQAAQFASSLGPALVLLAISAQISAMDRKLDETIALGKEVLNQLRRDHRSSLRGICETIDIAVQEAKEIGYVTKGVFAPVEPVISDLRSERDAFRSYFNEHRRQLSVGDAGKYVEEHSADIIGDAQGLMLAEMAQYRYGILRAGSLLDGDPSAHDEVLSRSVIERIERDSRQSIEQTVEAIDEVYARMRILALTSQPSFINRVPARRAAATAESDSVRIAEGLAAVLGSGRSDRNGVVPVIEVVDEAADEALEILRWALAHDEPLIALAEVRPQGLVESASYLGVTAHHLFVTPQKALLREGEIREIYPLSDLRYVRYTESKNRVVLDVITKAENLTFRLSIKSGTEPPKELADLLMSVAQVPECERRSSPLLESRPNRMLLMAAERPPLIEPLGK